MHAEEKSIEITDYNRLVAEYFRRSDVGLFEEREQEEQKEVYKPIYKDHYHGN